MPLLTSLLLFLGGAETASHLPLLENLLIILGGASQWERRESGLNLSPGPFARMVLDCIILSTGDGYQGIRKRSGWDLLKNCPQ